MPAVIDSNKCTKCQECVDVCPMDAISSAGEDQVPAVDADECTDCSACEDNCPAEAISME